MLFFGLIQPIMDGVKLIKKEQLMLINCSLIIFFSVSIFSFSLLFLEFLLLPYYYCWFFFLLSFICLLILLSFNVYFILLAGVFSKNKYSYMGGIRRSISRICFELCFSILIFLFIFLAKSFIIKINFLFFYFFLFFLFFIIVILDLLRVPFDYSESERELVRGFNVEYSRVGFVLFFLKEYRRFLFFSLFISSIIFNFSFFFVIFILYFTTLIRSSFPRVRYDVIIILIWYYIVFIIIIIIILLYFFIGVFSFNLI